MDKVLKSETFVKLSKAETAESLYDLMYYLDNSLEYSWRCNPLSEEDPIFKSLLKSCIDKVAEISKLVEDYRRHISETNYKTHPIDIEVSNHHAIDIFENILSNNLRQQVIEQLNRIESEKQFSDQFFIDPATINDIKTKSFDIIYKDKDIDPSEIKSIVNNLIKNKIVNYWIIPM